MTFTIWFVGMIAHVFLGDQTVRAVIVRPDMKHTAELRVKKDDVVTINNFSGSLKGDVYTFSLVGRSLSVETQSGPVASHESFGEHVPHLSKLVNAGLTQDVKNGAHDDSHVYGYVTYRGGCLSVEQVTNEDVTFHPRSDSDHARCLAKYVKYTVTTDLKEIVIHDVWHQDAWIKLKPSAAILIRNVVAHQPSTTPSHWDEYNWLTDATEISYMRTNKHPNCVPKKDTTQCPPSDEQPPEDRSIVTVSADCTNTQWP